MLLEPFLLAFESLRDVFMILWDYWWIWVPLVLGMVTWETMVNYHSLQYVSDLKWVLLELRVPMEAHKSLKGMEQVFAAFHALPQPFPPKTLRMAFHAWKEKYFKGKVQDWLSLELVSISGEIHYYVRVLEESRNMVEAQIYAHYPDSEITQVSDYMAQLPMVLPTDEIDMTSMELALIKEDIYPIKTYPEFEEQGAGRDDVRRIDPLAPIAEAMTALTFGEYLGIQILIRPTNDSWVKKGQPVLDKLMGKTPKGLDPDLLEKGMRAVDEWLLGPGKKDEEKKDKPFNQLNPGLQETIKAMERSFSKLAFETGIRLLYVAPKDRYNKTRTGAVAAAFKQFATQALNGFKPGFMAEVRMGFNKEQKTLRNKRILHKRYKVREFPKVPFVLNTEELTTIWHFPDIGVKTPSLPRIDAKKGEAPAGIPIV